MKEVYEAPVCEVIEFDAEDVITTSLVVGDIDDDEGWGPIN